MENRALILLASYNGEDYISKQIESIINQSYQNWDLYIRDDGSKDSTVSIVRSFAEHDNRIHLLDKTNRISGACLNFYELLRFAKSRIDDYKYFFYQIKMICGIVINLELKSKNLLLKSLCWYIQI